MHLTQERPRKLYYLDSAPLEECCKNDNNPKNASDNPKNASDNPKNASDNQIKRKSLKALICKTLLSASILSIIFELAFAFFSHELNLISLAISFLLALLVSGSWIHNAEYIKGNRGKNYSNSLYRGASGKAIMILAVIIPGIITFFICLHALSNLAEFGQNLAFSLMPLGILLPWQELRGRFGTLPALRRIIAAGSIIFQVILLGALLHSNQLGIDTALLLSPLFCFFILTCVLFQRLWKSELSTKASRLFFAPGLALLVILYMAPSIPLLLSDLRVLCLHSSTPELKKWASSPVYAEEFKASLESIMLRIAGPIHLPLDNSQYDNAYFFISGRHFAGSIDNYSWTDRYYAAPVIGDMLPLSIAESILTAKVNTQTMSSSFDWTFDFNTSLQQAGREARLLIELPANTAVTGLSLAKLSSESGKKASSYLPKEQLKLLPVFAAKKVLLRQYSEEALKLKDPVIASMIGQDRLLLQAAPILRNQPLRVSLHFVSPLLIDRKQNEAQIDFPYVAACNIKNSIKSRLELSSNTLLIGSTGPLNHSSVNFDARNKLEPLKSKLKASPAAAFLDKTPAGKHYLIKRSLKAEAKPSRFVIAIDGSISNQPAKPYIIKLLKEVPAEMKSRVFLALPNNGIVELNTESAADQLASTGFVGGDENWDLLTRSIDVAIKDNADVLWIHAAKSWPISSDWSSEIGYKKANPDIDLSRLCAGKVRVYDFQTERGDNQLIEKLNATDSDLRAFININKGNFESKYLFESLSSLREAGVVLSFAKSGIQEKSKSAGSDYIERGNIEKADKDLLALTERQELSELISRGKRAEAESYAKSHRLLSIYTAAICKQEQAKQVTLSKPEFERICNGREERPVAIIGSSNSQIRASSLATFESSLNIAANAFEIFGICWGLPMMLLGLGNAACSAGRNRLFRGLSLVLFGLATPGLINWLLASSRDGGGFS